MFVAKIFEIVREIGIASREERMIVVSIRGIEFIVRFVICPTVKAAPVRDFWKSINVRNETDITIVLIEPKRIKNCSRVCFPVICEPMIAA